MSNEKIESKEITFHDIRHKPFDVYGLYNYCEEGQFKRIPENVANATSEGVEIHCHHTAGARVRFSTDSDVIAVRTFLPRRANLSEASLLSCAGIDLYVDEPVSRISRFGGVFLPPTDTDKGYVAEIKFPSKKLRYITLNLPAFSRMSELFIGIKEDASLGEGLKYRNIDPIVYYGSSITQGGFASRPGNSYQNMICRRNNINFINLGFSGSGKAEDAIVKYMTGLKMSAFVCDYDHNAPDAEYLKATHLKMYLTMRKSHPTVPYIIISRPDFAAHYEESIPRRSIIFDTYRYALDNGDSNVYYIDGASIFRGPYEDSCLIDGTHPNDLGLALIADAVEAELKRANTQVNM